MHIEVSCRIARRALIALTLLLVAGCGNPAAPLPLPTSAKANPSATAAAQEKPPGQWTASEILQRLLATYRQATTYQDRGLVRLAYRQGGQPVSDEWPVAVAFERPGKLSLAAYQATVKCDGKQFVARIEDEATNHVDGQVVVRPAPADLKLADLASDGLLYDILSSRLRRQPIQLELLLESGGLVSAFAADVACQRLEDEKQAGRNCFRVSVPSPGGPFVFWVDQESFLLHRLDYPAAALVPDLAGDPAVSDVQLVAELREAKIGGAIDAGQFQASLRPGAKRMKTFVIPPRPLASSLFGQQPPEFHFTDLSGQRVAEQDLVGRTAVLAWYHDNPACEATLQQVSLARQRLKDEADVAFYAVATDPTEVSNEVLRRRLADWKVELPIVRDLAAFGDKAFQVAVQPTIVVLDKRGLVQIFEAGGNPQLADQLVQIVERLKRGDDLAAEIITQHERAQREYEQLLARGGPEPGEIIELPEAIIRRKSEPKHLKLTKLWTCSEVKLPGNMLLVESPDQAPRVFVFEGWRTMAEVSPEGRVIARHALALPEPAAVTYARTAADKNGRRYYAVSAPLAPQFFLFDESWKLLLAWPPTDELPLSLVDLAFADLNEGDGTPEILAASVEQVGLTAVSLPGEVLWRNRAFPNVLSIALQPPDEIGSWGVFLTGDSGGVLRVNRFGKEEPPASVGKWPILRLLTGRFPAAKQAALLALSSDAKNAPFAVGISRDLAERWNYPLPAGAHQRPIEPIASSHILPGRTGEWWLAGPDGSIHVVSEDGELFDSFHYGAALSGIAATQLAGRPVLLVAGDEGLSAWEIAAPLPPAGAQDKLDGRKPAGGRER